MTEMQHLRLRVGFSQQEAAHKMQVTSRTLGAWERGERRPRIHQRGKIAAVYEISLPALHRAIEATYVPRSMPRSSHTTIVHQ